MSSRFAPHRPKERRVIEGAAPTKGSDVRVYRGYHIGTIGRVTVYCRRPGAGPAPADDDGITDYRICIDTVPPTWVNAADVRVFEPGPTKTFRSRR